ncbi:MAG TPA: restriction endonuclease [Candidatus Saccharimonadales bacterium]|nr:restriction endonuclease [Candidatus Saccharimonadales bacterium]
MIHVLKANRSQEPFSEQKVMDSIIRARIPHSLRGEVLTHVKSKLYDNISTQEIYHHILEYLNTSPKPYIKARYSLKESIMQLGPTGYPFEDFIARLLETQGYTTQLRQILHGKCVSHEIDVIAQKDQRSVMIEAKFHNSPGVRSEVHVSLYTQARFEDIKIKNHIDEAWLVTNTKTTVDANAYAQCMGMRILSWDYPVGAGLRELIEESRLHPITMLTTLSQSQKMTLLENHIVLCKELLKDPGRLDFLYLSSQDRGKVLAEVSAISVDEE